MLPSLPELDKVRTVLFVILDSMRVDSFERARTPWIDSHCLNLERRHSYATWTQPSHACLLAGLLPFESRKAPAAETYASDLDFWSLLLTGSSDNRAGFAPHFTLACFASDAGWQTQAFMAMPVLNEQTMFSRGFATYQAPNRPTRLRGIFEAVLFDLDADKRNFIFINCGDTHYPYLLPPGQMPQVSGLNGAARLGGDAADFAFTADDMRAMHASQIEAIEQADHALGEALAQVPKPALVIVASDHGELFGEDGYFGHGPFAHPLLLDVPLAMGMVR